MKLKIMLQVFWFLKNSRKFISNNNEHLTFNLMYFHVFLMRLISCFFLRKHNILTFHGFLLPQRNFCVLKCQTYHITPIRHILREQNKIVNKMSQETFHLNEKHSVNVLKKKKNFFEEIIQFLFLKHNTAEIDFRIFRLVFSLVFGSIKSFCIYKISSKKGKLPFFVVFHQNETRKTVNGLLIFSTS